MKSIVWVLKYIALVLGILLLLFVLLFGHKDKQIDELKAKYAGETSMFLPLAGMDVHYRDEGIKSDSLPIVLIHGTASSLHTFDDWTDILKSSRRVIRLDMPAFGLTGPFKDRDYRIENYVAFLSDFLAAIDVKHCVLAGNSLGGEIAWNLALKKPALVEKLILIDATGYPKESESMPIAFTLGETPILKNILTYITPKFMVRASVEDVYFDKSKVSDSLVERYFDLTLREGNRQAFVDRLTVPLSDNYSNIRNILQPTLVLWGDNDLLIPVENGNKFHRDLPNSRLVVLKDIGHTPMEESPMESLEPVMAFLNGECID